ncbi:MAG: sugar phosphate isomerase/epimerase family protein [Planctomycetota bacterium]
MTNRRDFLWAATAATTASALTASHLAADKLQPNPTAGNVRFALNTSTIRGQKLSITQQVDLVAKAGYDGIEPWIRDIEAYVDQGGSLPDLKKRIQDLGITVDSAIGFAQWIVDDPDQRKAGLQQARKDMRLVKAIGGTRMAAPPIGAHKPDGDRPTLPQIAERYRDLLEVGAEEAVKPQLELWGFSPTLSQLSELAYVATGAGHPDACVLPDFYHIYKGGNDFAGLQMIEASKMECFHINDYPADPPVDQISDKDRVFPGDGVCPLPEIIAQLIKNGFQGILSLELFNRDYWQRDALSVAQEGLEKSKQVVASALA